MSKVFRKIRAVISNENALIVNINVKTSVPGTIQIVYGNKKAGNYISASTRIPNKKNNIQIVRLREETIYKYRVYLTTINGRIYISDQEYFITGQLPDNLTKSLKFTLKGEFSKDYITILCVNGIIVPKDFFQGYIGVDFAGKIVWYYEAETGETPTAGDFFQLESGNFLITRGHCLGTPVTLANIYQAAQMQIINATGKLLYQQPLVCMYNPDNIGVKNSVIANFGWTHAAWQDPGRKSRILALGLQLRDPFFDAGITAAGERMQLGETIREWVINTGEQNIITSAFELLDPITYRSELSNNDYGVPINCNGNEPGPEDQDWTHANAISRLNSRSNWTVSQRNTSSVLILDPRNFKLILKFGSVEPSDLSFTNANDKFYGQHDAHELDNGNILMFDDGTDRPVTEGGSYARALELAIDIKNKQITKVWEFRPKENLECNNNGSSRRLKNGNTIVDFGASNLSIKHIYEAGKKSNTFIGHLSVLSNIPNITYSIYRAIPIESLFGETPLH